jgi:putative transposase
MKFDSPTRHRRSIRLPEYDYSQAGAYFVTIVTWGKMPLFGEICEGEMRLSAAGRIVKTEWKRLAHQFSNIRLNAFVVMPNHVHGIIVIDDGIRATRHSSDDVFAGIEAVQADALAGPDGSPLRGGDGDEAMDFNSGDGRATRKGPTKGLLGAMIGQFKSRATKRIWSLPVYDHVPIWQRNYYEHIIRDQGEYESILAYIQTNPLRWVEDQLHPAAAPNPINQD